MEQEELRRILLVDDEEDIREVAAMALELVGKLEVLACGSGGEALQKAPEFAPQLIVMDVVMPAFDGPMTLAAMRKLPSLAGVPVIFMTANLHPRDIAYYRSLGALDVIGKPFEPMELASTIRVIWERRHRAAGGAD